MAIAVNGGHVSRAIDFYDKDDKYFVIGGSSTAWTDDAVPTPPDTSDFRLNDIVGLKKVDNAYMVVPDNINGTIVYRNQKWRTVPREIKTTIVSDIPRNTTTVNVASIAGLTEGAKVRINNLYEGKILNITSNTLTLDTPAPSLIPESSPLLAGAYVEEAKYVYVEGYLEYDTFPLAVYRQIGLCTAVTPKNANILKSAAFSSTGADEYTSVGILEILDNRVPMTRDISMRELISMIIEF